jgi:uncharacterized protein YcbK (DUF882 family)
LLLTLSASAGHAETTHVVAKGQTLGRIARRYHVTVAALREANGLAPRQRIHPGLSLVIPEKGHEARAKHAAELHKDKHGKKRGKADKDEPREKKGADKADRSGADKADKKGKARSRKEREAERREAALAKKRKGHVRLIRGDEKLHVRLLGRRGRLASSGLAGLSKMLRFGPTGERTAIDPRLAALIGLVSDHFGGKPLHVTSGYRPYSPAQYTRHSKHNLGRAIDFSVAGVPNTVLRDFCRTFRDAGVGFYPNSTFVHLDVRTGKAYWVDSSGPGEAPHYGGSRPSHSSDDGPADPEPHDGATGSPGPDPGSPDTP